MFTSFVSFGVPAAAGGTAGVSRQRRRGWGEPCPGIVLPPVRTRPSQPLQHTCNCQGRGEQEEEDGRCHAATPPAAATGRPPGSNLEAATSKELRVNKIVSLLWKACVVQAGHSAAVRMQKHAVAAAAARRRRAARRDWSPSGLPACTRLCACYAYRVTEGIQLVMAHWVCKHRTRAMAVPHGCCWATVGVMLRFLCL